MDSFKKFVQERYTNDNYYLLQYLKDEPMDIYNVWDYFCDWARGEGQDDHDVDEDELQERTNKVKQAFSLEILDDLEDEEPDIFSRLPKEIQKEFEQYYRDTLVDYIMQHDPAEAPTFAHMFLLNKRLLPRTTWLVHFTDDPESIQLHGFKYGVDQIDKLGLTTYFKKGSFYKSGVGYNFAFQAVSHYVDNAADRKAYGEHAVMFQNSGVLVHHGGDDEEQVIFWGANVDPGDIVVLKRYGEDDKWGVEPFDYRRGRDSKGGAVFMDSFEDVVPWVIKNFHQYRRVITGKAKKK